MDSGTKRNFILPLIPRLQLQLIRAFRNAAQGISGRSWKDGWGKQVELSQYAQTYSQNLATTRISKSEDDYNETYKMVTKDSLRFPISIFGATNENY